MDAVPITRFRSGDEVEIVDPHFVERVGYPRSVRSYEPDVERAFGTELKNIFGPNCFPKPDGLLAKIHPEKSQEELVEEMRSRVMGDHEYPAFRRVLADLCHMMARKDHFGGRERKIHLKALPQHQGKRMVVRRLKNAMTGYYHPPHSSGGFEYQEWNPAELGNRKCVRLAHVAEHNFFWSNGPARFDRELWIPVGHLRKIG